MSGGWSARERIAPDPRYEDSPAGRRYGGKGCGVELAMESRTQRGERAGMLSARDCMYFIVREWEGEMRAVKPRVEGGIEEAEGVGSEPDGLVAVMALSEKEAENEVVVVVVVVAEEVEGLKSSSNPEARIVPPWRVSMLSRPFGKGLLLRFESVKAMLWKTGTGVL